MIRNNQNRRRRSGSGPRPQQLAGGNNYGNRLDNRQRGNASQLLEKYRGLARDSQQAGDRVTAEYYLQYAEHYYRVLGDYRDRQGEPVRRPRDYEDEDSAGFSGMDQDLDGDEDEGETRRRPEGRSEGRGEGRGETRGGEARGGEDDRPSRAERQPQARSDRDYGRDRSDRGEREQAPRNRDRDWNRDEPRREEGRREEGRRDEPRREEPRREESRRDEARPDVREGRRQDRRSQVARPASQADEPSEGPIPGLPGPATLTTRRREQPAAPPAEVEIVPTPAAMVAAPVEAAGPDTGAPEAGGVTGEEQPAPRRRGRPRKVVAEV